MRSPIIYYGGKGNMVKKLIKLLPPHKVYVEVFGGGASLLFAKEPSDVEVYNDIDSGLVNLFRVLRDPLKFKLFYRYVYLTPVSREEQKYCAETWQQCINDVERAYRFFVAIRQSFSGKAQSWSFSVQSSNNKMAATCSRWLSTIQQLPEIHERLIRVQIDNKDFRELFKTYDSEDTLFYCDPPYIHETRRDKNSYNHEMTNEDHKDLVNILLNVKGKVLLSGYRHDIYKTLEENGWKRKDFKTACHATGRTRQTGIIGKGTALEKQPRIESVWLSPNNFVEKATLF